MKRFIICTALILCLTGCGNPYVSAYNYGGYTTDDIDTLSQLISEQDTIMDTAAQMADAARRLGYDDSHDIVLIAQQEWQEANALKATYSVAYDNLVAHKQAKSSEYPSAAYIWNYFKDLGYNDYVIAGIMGNIMAEVGGQTLNINYTARSASYYGMCQWSKGYSNVWGASLEQQCAFLQGTIKYEFDTYGSNYKKGFNYNSFMNLTDAKAAAKAFARCYERCAKKTDSQRQKNAIVAYNYFVG